MSTCFNTWSIHLPNMQKNPSSGPEGDWNPWKGCSRKFIRCISLCQIKCAHPSAVATPCEEGRSQNKLSLSIIAPHQEAIQYPLTQTIWWLKVIKVILFNLSTQSASSHAMDMLRPENYIFTIISLCPCTSQSMQQWLCLTHFLLQVLTDSLVPFLPLGILPQTFFVLKCVEMSPSV